MPKHLPLNPLALLIAALLAPFAALAEADKKSSTLLFVGGSGGHGATPTLERLKGRLGELDPKRGVVVFTGNYSTAELPPEGPGRAAAERHVLAHVTATQDFVKRGGQVYFLAGHTDFAEGGSKAVRRLRKFLNRSYEGDDESDDKLDVMPLANCGDLVELNLSESLTLVLFNSQWWMQDWVADPDSNEGCDLKTRMQFQLRMQSVFSGNRNRRLVVASHHPIASYGELGGAFTAGAHVRPAPILGTIGVLARQAGLVPQYQNHPMVRSYTDLLLDGARRYGGFVFASGHDASLQVLSFAGQTQLVSGSSARVAEPTASAADGDFAASSPGWIELEIDSMGAGEAKVVAKGELFRKRLPDLKSFGADPNPPPPVQPGPVSSGYSKKYVWQPGPVTQFFIGSFYSDAYGLSLPYDVLDLKTEQGGLTPFKTGGGLQTNSLRVLDPQGGDWAIRSTTKDSSRALPYPFNELKPVNRFIDHGFTATHPEGALAIPRLARAVGVLAPEPRLMYLPDQEGLGKFRGYVGDEVVMLERRPKEPKTGTLPLTLAGPPGAKGKTKFRSTEETLEKLVEKPEKHRVDQEAMLRARLLDLFVGDWDRHLGQWTFAVTTGEDDVKTYRPVARDRDQAFANYDGLGLGLVQIAAPLARNLQPFRAHYGSVAWLFFSGRDVDPLLLNRIPRDRWMAIAEEVKAALTDPVIDEAFATWHPDSYQQDGARISSFLKVRRERLVEAAEELFEALNENVDILGSTKADTFDLWFQPSGNVRVAVRTGTGPAFFDRTFSADDTDELRIYALEGDDALVIHGVPHSALGVRFVGGEGKDTVSASGGGELSAGTIYLYDSPEGATVDPKVSVTDKRSDLANLNQFNRSENHDPDYFWFIPGLQVNPDDGVYLGGTLSYLVHGYKKSPFAAKHDLTAYFATATLGAAIDYHGLFPQSVHLLDQQLHLSVWTPIYTRNFYGYTNHYDDSPEPADFHRVRQARYEGRYGLSFGFGGDRTRVGVQLVGQAIVTEPTEGRFVTVSPDVTPDVFGPRYFGGARLFAQTSTYDNPVFPSRGVALHVSADGRYDLARGNQLSTNYKVAAATAIPFDRQQRFVLLTRVKLEGIVGDHPFYFAPTLGEGELRAYPRQHFAGDFAFAHSTDLRVEVFRIYSGLPGSIGFNVSADHGRVFGPTITGDEYHLSLGGGVWWFLLDTFGLSLNYHRSLDGAYRFSFAVGPLFADTGF